MSFVLAFLGTILGILGALAIIIIIIYVKVSQSVGKENMKELVSAMKNSSNIELQQYQEKKSISGMTSILEPAIIEDFPEFNKDLLYASVEECLREIFNALENKSIDGIKNNQKLSFMINTVEKIIEDYKSANINVEYNDIKFHDHAIKDYRKQDGKATVSISSTLEYYYKSNKKKEKVYEGVKKQTRYTTKFVYVYDETKFKDRQLEYSIFCPSCGAPIRGTKDTVCEYCGSAVKAINLKAWKMIYYKEDY
jgi:rubrerythrin